METKDHPLLPIPADFLSRPAQPTDSSLPPQCVGGPAMISGGRYSLRCLQGVSRDRMLLQQFVHSQANPVSWTFYRRYGLTLRELSIVFANLRFINLATDGKPDLSLIRAILATGDAESGRPFFARDTLAKNGLSQRQLASAKPERRYGEAGDPSLDKRPGTRYLLNIL